MMSANSVKRKKIMLHRGQRTYDQGNSHLWRTENTVPRPLSQNTTINTHTVHSAVIQLLVSSSGTPTPR